MAKGIPSTLAMGETYRVQDAEVSGLGRVLLLGSVFGPTGVPLHTRSPFHSDSVDPTPHSPQTLHRPVQ